MAEMLSHSLRWTLTMCNMLCHPRCIIWPSNRHTYSAAVKTADGSLASICRGNILHANSPNVGIQCSGIRFTGLEKCRLQQWICHGKSGDIKIR
ncbi:hypothetical protein CEXT_313771 [Caerostris extrusa]|uniref:Uncharacterized protein n=1 Tax=Caerostris extrusa TaxID=172846 RepID=A0AAV4QI17_CAEEX|nr:hypothetical protein CEXT_313771 [Caerostris extrusa]